MRFTSLMGAIILGLGLSAGGQEPPLPKPQTQEPVTKTAEGAGSPSPSTAPNLIPAEILSTMDRAAAPAAPPPPGATIPQLDETFKQNALSATAENARQHAEWRQLQNRVVSDAEVQAALHRAERASTDLVKRKLLRDYYEIYFGKMIALASAPETIAYLKERKKDQLHALPQPRVRPESSPSSKPRS